MRPGTWPEPRQPKPARENNAVRSWAGRIGPRAARLQSLRLESGWGRHSLGPKAGACQDQHENCRNRKKYSRIRRTGAIEHKEAIGRPMGQNGDDHTSARIVDDPGDEDAIRYNRNHECP